MRALQGRSSCTACRLGASAAQDDELLHMISALACKGLQNALIAPHDEAMTQGQAGYIWCAHLATALRARPTRAAARPMQAFEAVHEHVLRAEVPL